MDTEQCICDIVLYKIRPGTFQFMLATYPKFEIIAFSDMDKKSLIFIIDTLEHILDL